MDKIFEDLIAILTHVRMNDDILDELGDLTPENVDYIRGVVEQARGFAK